MFHGYFFRWWIVLLCLKWTGSKLNFRNSYSHIELSSCFRNVIAFSCWCRQHSNRWKFILDELYVKAQAINSCVTPDQVIGALNAPGCTSQSLQLGHFSMSEWFLSIVFYQVIMGLTGLPLFVLLLLSGIHGIKGMWIFSIFSQVCQ